MLQYLRRIGLVLLGGVIAGCVAPRPTEAYVNAYDQAARLERDNHPDQAAEAYGQAAEAASRSRTRVQALFRQARQLERAGQRDEAEQLYLQIVENYGDGEMASRSLYYAGRMAFENGQFDHGLQRMRQVIENYPHKAAATQALRRAVQQLTRHQNADQTLRFLADLEPRVRGTDVGDNVLFHWACLEQEDNRWQAALSRLERLVELYPYPSGLYDDALWRAANIALEQRQPQRALGYLEQLVQWVEPAIGIGSNVTNWSDDSQLLIGKIYLEQLESPARAAAAFEKLATFPDSILADDGLWWAAKAYERLHDRPQSCRTLLRLLNEFPDSNKRRHARRQLTAQDC
jgi:TolA-binding protein